MFNRFCLTMHSVASHYGSFLAVSCISKISIACVNLRFCSENGRLIRYDEHPIYGFREMLFSQLNERHGLIKLAARQKMATLDQDAFLR